MVLHKNNIEIPALFSFRPCVAKWQASWAEVVDWGEAVSRTLKPLFTMAAPVEEPARKKSDSVIVRVTLPGARAMLHSLYGTSQDLEIEIQRKELPDGILRPDETPISTPDIAGREFAVLVSELPESAGLFLRPKPATKEKERNVWTMCEKFFSLEPSLVELKTFLNAWGPWDGERRYPANGHSLDSVRFALVIPDAVWRQREGYRKAQSGSSRAWLRKASPLTFSTLEEWPHFVVKRSTCQSAIEATITIEHLRGAKYGFCKRCRGRFERDTLHKKNYCSRTCIQADATARWRANQRKEAKKQGGKKDAKG
jgi:hypothetical protein